VVIIVVVARVFAAMLLVAVTRTVMLGLTFELGCFFLNNETGVFV
jgi:hypothetical protein